MWRSDDAGEHWRAVNSQRALIGRAGYYIRLAVSTGAMGGGAGGNGGAGASGQNRAVGAVNVTAP